MIYSESALARRIFSRFLPAYASRAGYFEGVSPEGLFPEGIYPIPVHLAPAASLDGIWVDSAHAPENSRELAALLQTLGAGGIGVLFLRTKHWNRRAIRDFCRGAAMQLLFLSPIPAKGRVKLTPAGLPVPKSILRRFALRFVTSFFPSLAGLFGRELFVIVQKSPARHRETDGMRLSVIIPAITPDRLHQWEDFIAKHRVHEIELISVEEDVMPASKSGSTIHVQHYREAGRAAAIRSGLLHSRGKAVLLDNDQRCAPAYLFDLMQARMQAKQKVDVVAGLDAAERPWWPRRFLNRWLTGFSDPEPLYLLLSDKAIRDLIDVHPDQLSGYAYATGLRLRSRLQIEEVDLVIEPPLPPRKIKAASIISYLIYRLRRGAIYLLFPLLLPALLPVPAAFPASLPEWSHLMPGEAIHTQAARAIELEHWTQIPDTALTLGANAVLLAEKGLAIVVHRGEQFVDRMIRPELQKELAARFFFVLIVGLLIHVWNVVSVFGRPSGSLLPWIMAQAEALSILFLLLEFEPSALQWSTAMPAAFLPVVGGSHLLFFGVYYWLFRYRT